MSNAIQDNLIQMVVLSMSMSISIFMYTAARNSNVIYTAKEQSNAPTPRHGLLYLAKVANEGKERRISYSYSAVSSYEPVSMLMS